MNTITNQMKNKLEKDAGINFVKVDTYRHVSYYASDKQKSEIVFARTLADCVWRTAQKLGE